MTKNEPARPAVLRFLQPLVGAWTTEATHRMMPGLVVHGTIDVEWLEGERFQIHRARTDHEKFPDSISIVGVGDQDHADDAGNVAVEGPLRVHYFDSRGVVRVYDAAADADGWRYERLSGFAQRFVGRLVDGGARVEGVSQLREHDAWVDDLKITWRRR